jgi:AcrR family transcriptional regulator
MKAVVSREERQRLARETTRRAVLDAALELFIANGYAQVSIRNIAVKVEYSPAAIYSYFSSKDEIFFALAEEGFRLLGARALTPSATDDPVEALRNVAWRFYEFSKEQPEYFALVFLDRHVPRIGREYEQFAFMSEMKNRILAQIDRAIENGTFPRSTHSDVAMRLLFAPIVGIVSLKLSQRLAPNEDPDALVRDAIETTLVGLKSGAPSHACCRADGCSGSNAT